MARAPHWAIASPALFGVHASGGQYRIARHVEVMDDAILRAAGGGRFLIIELPPRHGKSTLVSGWLPPWYLGTFPTRRVILVSYEADFAQSWGRRARETFSAWSHIFPGKPRPSRTSAARGRWNIDGHPEAGMIATGIGGSVTGRGGDLIVVDDYVKNAEQARSTTYRERTWDWWQSTMRTRLQPGGSIVVMATRWHEDDLIGRLLVEEGLESDGGLWERIRLPALAEDGDPLGRAPGEALWPETWPEDALGKLRASVGPYWFAALFQQSPRVEGGGLFKRTSFRYFDPPDWEAGNRPTVTLGGRLVGPHRYRVFQTVDVADSEAKSADYTVVATWAWTEHGDLVLLDRVRERMEGPNVLRMAEAAASRWGPDTIAVERASYGTALIRGLRRTGLPVRAVNPDRDKVTRALPYAAMVEDGTVWWPRPIEARGTGWVAEWEEEHLSFPNAAHDDQVDVGAYAARLVGEWGRGIADPDDADPMARRVSGLSRDLAERF